MGAIPRPTHRDPMCDRNLTALDVGLLHDLSEEVPVASGKHVLGHVRGKGDNADPQNQVG